MLHKMMAPVDVHFESLETVGVLPYVAKGLCSCGSWDGKIILDYPSVPHVITSVLIKGR